MKYSKNYSLNGEFRILNDSNIAATLLISSNPVQSTRPKKLQQKNVPERH